MADAVDLRSKADCRGESKHYYSELPLREQGQSTEVMTLERNFSRGVGRFCLFQPALCEGGTVELSISHTVSGQRDSVSDL